MGHKVNRLPFFPIPVIIRIKCARKDRHIGIDAVQNIIQIFAVIGKIISFKYFLIFIMAVFVSRQKKYSVSFLPQFQDHAVHQSAGSANKQNIHLFSFLLQSVFEESFLQSCRKHFSNTLWFLVKQIAHKRDCLWQSGHSLSTFKQGSLRKEPF